jgi:arylsulfatase A-like enzyme
MAELATRGVAQNTLVVITSDHGESLGQHGLESHGAALYRELIRVPLIFWFPGRIPSGERVPENVSNAAIPATVMGLLSGRPGEFPEPSLREFLHGHPMADEPFALSELAQNHFLSKKQQVAAAGGPTAISGSMQSLVVGSWHLVVHETLGVQLYNWVNDPGELHDESHTAEGRQVVGQMVERLDVRTSQPRN